MLKKLFFVFLLSSFSLQAIERYPVDCPYPDFPDHEYYPIEGMECYPFPSDSPSGYPYESYPGIAYESSISTGQVITTVAVGIAVIAIVIIAFKNPTTSCHHSH